MASWQILLLIIGGISAFLLLCFILFLVGWGLLSAYIAYFSDDYFGGLREMLDDLIYCRINLPKVKNELNDVKRILSKCPKNNEYEQNSKL